MISAHLPVLLVVIPLISAPLLLVLRNRTFSFVAAVAVAATTLLIAVLLFQRAATEGVISYAIGSWPPPWGIEYRIDALNTFVAVIVTLIAAFVVPYSKVSVAHELPADQHYLFYALLMLCLAGLLGITLTGDAFNLFVFLEISSLSTYVLIALGRDRRALMAGYQYLIMGTIGATFYIIGVGLLYLKTGTLNLADMAARIPLLTETRGVLAALAFITVGVSLKLALFPLHLWLPNAYTYAPSTVSAFLAATATKVSVYVLLRYYFTIFGADLVFDRLPVEEIVLGLSIAAIFVASAVAIFQNNVKRMLAYSSVAQIGYITLGIGIHSQTGLTGSILHLFNHALTKGAMFLLLGGVALRVGGVGFERIAGLGRTMPVTAFAFVIAGLSLVGIPATVGVVSKWYLVLAAVEAGAWWLAAVVLLGSLLAVAYVWRFVEAAYFQLPAADHPHPGEAPLSMLVPACLMVAACVYFGLDATWSANAAAEAARVLLGAGASP